MKIPSEEKYFQVYYVYEGKYSGEIHLYYVYPEINGISVKCAYDINFTLLHFYNYNFIIEMYLFFYSLLNKWCQCLYLNLKHQITQTYVRKRFLSWNHDFIIL